MLVVFILEDNDTICLEDYYRPLRVLYSDLGGIHFSGTYTRKPINNFKWLPVKGNLGSVWIGKKVSEFNNPDIIPHEFCRGVLPVSHIL